MDITKQVIELLRKQSPVFNRFFEFHFELIEEQSLTPSFTSEGASFPVASKIRTKELNLVNKLVYFYFELREYIPKTDLEKYYIEYLMRELGDIIIESTEDKL